LSLKNDEMYHEHASAARHYLNSRCIRIDFKDSSFDIRFLIGS
jgi:hypothetical protein